MTGPINGSGQTLYHKQGTTEHSLMVSGTWCVGLSLPVSKGVLFAIAPLAGSVSLSVGLAPSDLASEGTSDWALACAAAALTSHGIGFVNNVAAPLRFDGGWSDSDATIF